MPRLEKMPVMGSAQKNTFLFSAMSPHMSQFEQANGFKKIRHKLWRRENRQRTAV